MYYILCSMQALIYCYYIPVAVIKETTEAVAPETLSVVVVVMIVIVIAVTNYVGQYYRRWL